MNQSLEKRASLLRTDSVHREFPGTVSVDHENQALIINGHRIAMIESNVPEDIDYIHAHGTATELNDRHEANLIQQIFRQKVAVSSTKGATGHTLGASGALGVVFCLMAIEHQVLPPCVGLNDPEFDLDLVRYARQSQVKNVLCLSFGFGGQNAALALSNV